MFVFLSAEIALAFALRAREMKHDGRTRQTVLQPHAGSVCPASRRGAGGGGFLQEEEEKKIWCFFFTIEKTVLVH